MARWKESPTKQPTTVQKGPDSWPDPGIDPYFRWALHTDFRGFARLAGWTATASKKRLLQLLVQAQDPAHLDLALKQSRLQVSPSYHHPARGTTRRARHFVAHLDASEANCTWLLENKLRLRWKLAMPLRDAGGELAAQAKGVNGPSTRIFPAQNVIARDIVSQQPLDHPAPARCKAGALAVIDFACPFLHRVFADPVGTRVAGVWDQGSQPDVRQSPDSEPAAAQGAQLSAQQRGWPWMAPASFLWGRELGPHALNAMALAWNDPSRALEETAIYRGIGHLIDHDDARRRVWFATHGGHVFSVAGGKPDPVGGDDQDAAASADLLFVQLPSSTASDSSGGSLAAHVLDGIRWAMEAVPKNKPLVVNISYGNSAGPHDGSSLIEEALDELLEARGSNFAIVLAAGNARQSKAHASRVAQPGRSVMLRCQISAGDTTDTFVEIWYPRATSLDVEVRVRAPDSDWSAWVPQGQELPMEASTVDQEIVAMLRHDAVVPNGAGSMALLAITATAMPEGVTQSLAPAGLWEVEIRVSGKAGEELPIEAWIERDDPGRGTGVLPPSFLDQSDEDDRNTLSSLATGVHTVRVGGFNRGRGREAPYSSRGRAGDGLPQLLAVCEEDEVDRSIRAAATRSSEVYRLNGTSIAAPVVARRLFNWMVENGPVQRNEWLAVIDHFASGKADPDVKGLPAD
jgi:hypothetical protein